MDQSIVCVECGGTCRVLSYPPEEGWQAGDIIAYRCVDCADRFDIVYEPFSPDDDEG